ncbi:response regulator, partial [Parabacteroides distasonis]
MISVLVTEDELPILRSTSKLIEKCNSCFYVKYRATNGQEALEIIKQNNIDLLVLDIHMPVMNGIDLLKIMQKEEIKIPTVVLSGYQDFQYVRQAMLLGAMDYLLKPLKISDLNNILFKAEGIILYNNCINKKISKKNSITCNSAYELALINFDDKAILNEEQQLTKEQKKIETNLEEFLVNSISKEDYWIFQDKQLIEKTFIFRKSGHRTENLLKTFFNEYSNHINKITIVVSNTEYQLNTLYEGNKKINDHLREVICINKSVFSVLEENQSNKENINQIQEYKNFIKTAQFPEE